ncbi:hypothetical protein ACOMHN_003370 [Nucella lapillus]
MDTPSTSTGGDTAFVCSRCNKAFTRRDVRDRHVRLVHHRRKLYQCPVCGQEFGRKYNYDSHRRVCKEEEEDLAYLCLDCDNVFGRKRDLVRHACKKKGRKRKIPHPPAVDLSPRKRDRPAAAVVEEETEVTVPGDIPEEAGELYRDNWGAVRTHSVEGRHQKMRHEKSCTGKLVKHRYPGGVYTPPSTPLEILQRNGLNVDTAYVYPYRATYDYEAYFDRDDLPQNPESDNTRYTSRHVPMSLAVSSNVPSYDEPVCFVSERNPQKLVDRMFDHLEEIAQHAYLLSREEFADVYDELAAMVQEEEEDKGEERVTGLGAKELEEVLDAYLRRMPMVGFNSGKEKRDNPALRRFLLENCPNYVSPFHGLIGTEDVIRKVEEGKLFGMVQCDVEVPDRLRVSFAEMLPVFKNAEVGLDDVGDYMKAYAEEHGLLR